MPTIIVSDLIYNTGLRKIRSMTELFKNYPTFNFRLVCDWVEARKDSKLTKPVDRNTHVHPTLIHCSWVTSLSANSLSPCVYSLFSEPALSLVKTIIKVKLCGRLNRFLRNITLVLQALSSFLIIWKMAAFPWKATLNPLGL